MKYLQEPILYQNHILMKISNNIVVHKEVHHKVSHLVIEINMLDADYK